VNTVEHITRIASATGEQRLAAAMLADAIAACRVGCRESCSWLECRGLDYVAIITPAGRDPVSLAHHLAPAQEGQQCLWP
jgi:hypothetical protein